MIRSAVVLLGLAALASAAMMEIPIVKSSSEVRSDGFTYEWETGNGIKAEARGMMKDAETQVIQGSYAFTADDGQTYEVQYTADENGFHPQGAHLPTPPPMPEAIAKALEWIAAHPDPKAKDH